jgi:hypothetical protein
MKTKLMLALFTLLVAGAVAQTAVVVQLKECDATQAQQLYAAKQAADKAWADFYAHVEKAYGLVGDIEFSQEFRFIVPKPLPVPGWQMYGGTVPLIGAYTPMNPTTLPYITTDEYREPTWTIYGSPITKGPVFEDRWGPISQNRFETQFGVQPQQSFDNFFDVQQYPELKGAFAVPHPQLAPGTVIGEPAR